MSCTLFHVPLWICLNPESKSALERDANHAFKFHIGDKVKKRWKWDRKISNNRFGVDFPGFVGEVIAILPDGEICVMNRNGGTHWHFGATELDIIASVEAPETPVDHSESPKFNPPKFNRHIRRWHKNAAGQWEAII